ncbi:MAG: winged helix-turn-helix domain-containing protein [Roseiflexaceae bacterium]
MPQITTLLLIVSDAALITTLIAYLRDEGYRVIHTADGLEGLRAVRSARPDMIILDAALSGDGAIALCGMLRKETGAPLVLLTSGADEFEQIIGLDMGADLCLVKPVSLAELRARVRALLRRAAGAAARRPQPLTVGQLRLDADRRRAWVGERELRLTSREFDLLAYFMRHCGLVLPRAQLLRDVWGERVSQRSRTLEVHIRWLRQKVEPDPAQPTYIQTVRQIGYRFDGP